MVDQQYMDQMGSPVALAHLVGYDDVQTVTAASLKLLPLDPTEVAAWDGNLDRLGSATPMIDEPIPRIATPPSLCGPGPPVARRGPRRP